ncbi:MAG: ABC transporter permease [Acidobacteriaceae bacterium]|nr:ABC transporter permease [Acidobacteriaceae bacterium]MBV9778747.1 ABC transporter permease [Acidobacteriaceae bacterium]
MRKNTGGPDAVLISDRFWRRRFHADPNTIGKRIRLEKHARTIVGIMPASFLFPDRDVDVWSRTGPQAKAKSWPIVAWFQTGTSKPCTFRC